MDEHTSTNGAQHDEPGDAAQHDEPGDATDGARADGPLADGGTTADDAIATPPKEPGVPAAPDSGTFAGLERREYLRALGAAGAATVVGGTSVTAASAQSSLDEAAADQRIRDTQMGPLTVEVVDGNGNPVSGASVDVEMQEHDFRWGTAVNARVLQNQSANSNYRQYIPELFNTAVLENNHKWRFWENNQDRADWATDWLDQREMEIRGHCCIWGRADVSAIPDRILTAIDNDDAQTIREESMAHIEDIITHYGDQISEWEVVNEALHARQMQMAVYPDGINDEEPWTGSVVPWRSQLLADWYSKAQSVIQNNGYDIGICVNDFNTFAYNYTRDWYPSQIEFLENQGIDIDGIGHQAHVAARTGEPNTNDSPDARLTYAQIDEVLNLYADYDATQRITEYDMYNGNDWNSQQERADVMHRYLKTAFGHPDVEYFLVWGFWDGRHWENEAPFFQQDWSEKPALDVYRNLVFDEWWTSESGTTDSSGTYSVDATLGRHQVSVTAGGSTVTREVEVTDASAGATVQVQVTGGTTPTPESCDQPAAPAWSDGTTPYDVDGDGVYEDMNGNCEFDSDDVVTYFQQIDRDGIQQNPSYYDANGNGNADFDDIVTLFQSL